MTGRFSRQARPAAGESFKTFVGIIKCPQKQPIVVFSAMGIKVERLPGGWFPGNPISI
jgi:hypothetical protein